MVSCAKEGATAEQPGRGSSRTPPFPIQGPVAPPLQPYNPLDDFFICRAPTPPSLSLPSILAKLVISRRLGLRPSNLFSSIYLALIQLTFDLRQTAIGHSTSRY